MNYEKTYFYLKGLKFYKLEINLSAFKVFIVGNKNGMFISYPSNIDNLKGKHVYKVYGTTKSTNDFNDFLNSPLIYIDDYKNIFKGMLVKDALLVIS
jgi:hypothetical protein